MELGVSEVANRLLSGYPRRRAQLSMKVYYSSPIAFTCMGRVEFKRVARNLSQHGNENARLVGIRQIVSLEINS